MAAVLELLGVPMPRGASAQRRGPCPCHGSTTDTNRCFSVNLDRNYFHCFKCGRSGNALDLWAQATRQPFYQAALDLCQRLAIPLPTPPATDWWSSQQEPEATKTGLQGAGVLGAHKPTRRNKTTIGT